MSTRCQQVGKTRLLLRFASKAGGMCGEGFAQQGEPWWIHDDSGSDAGRRGLAPRGTAPAVGVKLVHGSLKSFAGPLCTDSPADRQRDEEQRRSVIMCTGLRRTACLLRLTAICVLLSHTAAYFGSASLFMIIHVNDKVMPVPCSDRWAVIVPGMVAVNYYFTCHTVWSMWSGVLVILRIWVPVRNCVRNGENVCSWLFKLVFVDLSWLFTVDRRCIT